MYLSILFISLAVHVLSLLLAKRWDRAFAGVLLFSHAYFCVGGYYYWVHLQDGHFVGSRWTPDELLFGISILSMCTTAFCAFGVMFRRKLRIPTASPGRLSREQPLPKAWRVFAALGTLSALVVMAQILARTGLRGDVSLVAYQLSDCLIPVLVYYVAVKGLNKRAVVALALFAIYASIVGFRYKIALVAIPVLCYVYYSNTPSMRKAILLGGGAMAMLALFAVLTLFRNKFAGISFENASARSVDDLMYGLFAETNIVFGLSAVNVEFLQKGHAIGLVPIWDTFKEWVPRSLYPGRVSGEYLTTVGLGLYTTQGARSGTAYPYIGEFIIMFGWAGIFIAPFFLALLYRFITNYMSRWSPSSDFYAGGVGILVAMLCYYNYSRGYLPQISKAYICVLLPYLLMIRGGKKAQVRAASLPPVRQTVMAGSPVLRAL